MGGHDGHGQDHSAWQTCAGLAGNFLSCHRSCGGAGSLASRRVQLASDRRGSLSALAERWDRDHARLPPPDHPPQLRDPEVVGVRSAVLRRAGLCMANSYLLLRCDSSIPRLPQKSCFFEVSLAKHFIRPGQVLRYVAVVRTRTHLTRMGYTGTSESKF